MKLKKENFTIMAPHTTCACTKPIKANVANRKKGPLQCFRCHKIEQASRNHFMQTARDIRKHPSQRSGRRIDKHIPLKVA